MMSNIYQQVLRPSLQIDLMLSYIQEGANVLFFTFINPATMDVPAAFQKLGNFFKCFWFKTQGQLKQLYVYLRYENDGKNDYLYACNSQLQPAALVWKELFLLTL